MNIGRAAKATRVSAKMIRHYESIGLIGKAARTEAGYRVYGTADIHVLRFIRRARDLGFSIERISKLIKLWQDRERTSAEVKAVALDHVHELRTKIAEMEAMARTLEHLANHCQGDDRPGCPILDDLAGPEEQSGSCELVHRHEATLHRHRHLHDAHHQHAHHGREGPVPHSHPHQHTAQEHRHAFVIDQHHTAWPKR